MIAILLFLILAYLVFSGIFRMTLTAVGGILGAIIVIIVLLVAKRRRK